MQIIVALNLLLALSATQLQANGVGADVTTNSLCVVLSMIMSVIFAQILLYLTQNRFGDTTEVPQDVAFPVKISPDWLQLAVWTAFSLMVTFVFQWTFIATTAFEPLVLLPQAMTLLPHLVCLLLMWAIGDWQPSATTVRERLGIIGSRQYARIQMLLIPILLPIFAVYGVRSGLDSFSDWQALPTVTQTVVLSFSAMAILLLTYPLLLSRLWTTRPLAETYPDEGRQLELLGRKLRLQISQVELWKTQLRIANAAVVGWIPGVRKILVSDVLVRILTRKELEAVFLHEAGHIRHSHTLWRLTTVLLPLMLILMAMAGRDVSGTSQVLQQEPVFIFAALLLFVGSAGLLSWFAKELELEADRYVWKQQQAREQADAGETRTDNPLVSAMLKTARVTESSLHQTSLLHPTTANRVRQICLLNEHPEQATRLDNRLALLKRCLIIFFLVCIFGVAFSTHL